MRPPSRPTPEPLEVNVRPIVIVGTGLWFVAFVVVLATRGRLGFAELDDWREWMWTTLAGWVLGLAGLVLVRAQTRAAARRAARKAGR